MLGKEIYELVATKVGVVIFLYLNLFSPPLFSYESITVDTTQIMHMHNSFKMSWNYLLAIAIMQKPYYGKRGAVYLSCQMLIWAVIQSYLHLAGR